MSCFNGIYFDHAATSYPKPTCVLKAVERALTEEGGNAGRSGHALALRAALRVYAARETIADFFGLSDPSGVVFTKNATEALNLAVHTFCKNGGHVLCDDMAHNALVRPLYHLSEEGRIRLSFYRHSAKANDISKQIEDDTVLLCATHASNICGARIDGGALGALCRARRIAFLLDASQSAGHLPIHCTELGADAVCVPAHKGLYGIMGAGAVLFPHPQEDYPAFLTGGSGAYSLSREMPKALPEHFEAGTLPLPAIAAFEAGVAWVKKIGLDEITSHIKSLEQFVREGLAEVSGIVLHGQDGGGILSFTHRTISPERVASHLNEAGIAVRAGLHCAPLAHKALGTLPRGTVRVSLGYTNTHEDCEKFLQAIQKIAD